LGEKGDGSKELDLIHREGESKWLEPVSFG
jgi:hypothetical protein